MILEEIIGSFVSLFSKVIIQTPSISRETPQRDSTLIAFEENLERDEVYDGLKIIHREYEQNPSPELPYYEGNVSVLWEDVEQTERTFCVSILRSFNANVGYILAAIFILGLLVIGTVFLDLNTKDVCIEWMHKNLNVSSRMQIIQRVGMSISALPVMLWFPASVIMLWGFKDFKKNYLCFLCLIQLITLFFICVYNVLMLEKLATTKDTIYILPTHLLFISAIVYGSYLVARKFKRVNPATSCSVWRISFVLSFTFLLSCLLSYIIYFIIIKEFIETTGRINKAIIAALAPGITIPLTAISKYLALGGSSEFITLDRAFVLCCFIRGASIVVCRAVQSGFKDIWIFVGLSLLHGVSNVLSKATLNIRIKVWSCIIKCINNACCGPGLEVRSLRSARGRRFGADLEIRNILFECTTIVLSQTFLACYLLVNFDMPPWKVIKGSLIRIAISLTIDFVFNIVSVLIQVHFCDIPMRGVWLGHWRRHVIANAFMIVIFVTYFGSALVKVFAADNYAFKKEYNLRNCTTIF